MRNSTSMVCILAWAILNVAIVNVGDAGARSPAGAEATTDQRTIEGLALGDFFPEDIREQPIIKATLEKLFRDTQEAGSFKSTANTMFLLKLYTYDQLTEIETGIAGLATSTTGLGTSMNEGFTTIESEIRHIGDTLSNIRWVIIVGIVLFVIISLIHYYRILTKITV